LTLEDNWPGPAQTNAAYKIELTNPDVIAVEAMRRVLGSLSGGILYGVSQLTAAPNKALTIDETGAVALADLTTFGKSLIAALNSSAAYTALGTVPNGQIPARLQATASFVSAANALDNITESGWVKVSSANVAAVNGPSGGGSGNVFTLIHDGAAATQEFISVSVQGRRWNRRKLSSAWTAWQASQVGDVTDISSITSGAFRGWSFGAGTASATLDANALVGNGLFFVQPGSTNTPSNGWGYILQFQRDVDRKTQVFYDSFSSNPRQYIRGQLAEGWSVWRTNPFAQTSTTDTTATAAMLVGAFGLGGSGVLLAATDDLNNLPIATCSYRWGSTAVPSNAPSSGSYLLEHVSFGSGGCVQTAYNLSLTNIIWHRKQAGGTWTAWKRIDGSSDTVGDVTGPASSVDNGLAVYSGTTGKVLKAAPNSIVTNALLSNVATATIKGRTAAGTGDVQDLTPPQARTVMDVVPSAARQVRLGAQGAALTVIDQWTIAPSGSFLTAIRSDGIYAAREVAYRAVQQTDVSGNWVTVAQV
jgi:hypothetical protein